VPLALGRCGSGEEGEPVRQTAVTMRIPTMRRRWVALAVLLLLVIGCAGLLDRPQPINYYRVDDDRTLVVGVTSGPGSWTRVTSVTETSTTVTVSVSSLTAPLPSAGGQIIELTVHFSDPFADRTFIDGSGSQFVIRTQCQLPDVYGPGCT
jgi:hypothetical protein